MEGSASHSQRSAKENWQKDTERSPAEEVTPWLIAYPPGDLNHISTHELTPREGLATGNLRQEAKENHIRGNAPVVPHYRSDRITVTEPVERATTRSRRKPLTIPAKYQEAPSREKTNATASARPLARPPNTLERKCCRSRRHGKRQTAREPQSGQCPRGGRRDTKAVRANQQPLFGGDLRKERLACLATGKKNRAAPKVRRRPKRREH